MQPGAIPPGPRRRSSSGPGGVVKPYLKVPKTPSAVVAESCASICQVTTTLARCANRARDEGDSLLAGDLHAIYLRLVRLADTLAIAFQLPRQAQDAQGDDA